MWLVFLLLCKEEGSSPVSLQLLSGEIWPLYGALVFVGFWDEYYLC